MKLSRGSRFVITLVAWAFLTAMVGIQAYEAGYVNGQERAIKIFAYYLSH